MGLWVLIGACLMLNASCSSGGGVRPTPPPVFQSLTLTWTATNEDETGAPIADVDSYVVSYSAAGAPVQNLVYAAPQQSVSIRLPAGCYVLTVTAHSASRGASAPSNQVKTGDCLANTDSRNRRSLWADSDRPRP